MQDASRHIPVTIRMTEPQRYAKGGLVKAAEQVRGAGRHGDDMVIHVNRDEFNELRKNWGEPSINPDTGLPEFFLSGLQSWFKQNPWASAALGVGGSLLGGSFLGDGISSLTGGAISGTAANALGSGLLGAGVGGLTGGGKGALLGGLGGAGTSLVSGLLSGDSLGLGSIFGSGSGSSSAASDGSVTTPSNPRGGLTDAAMGNAVSGDTANSNSASGSSSSTSSIGSGALSGLLNSKAAIPLAIGALALASGFASKKPSPAAQAAQAQATAAQQAFNQHLASTVPFVRTQVPLTADQYHHYGEGPAHSFFDQNQLPATAARGGLIQRYDVGGQVQPGAPGQMPPQMPQGGPGRPMMPPMGQRAPMMPQGLQRPPMGHPMMPPQMPPQLAQMGPGGMGTGPTPPAQLARGGQPPQGALSRAPAGDNSAPPQHPGVPTGNYVRGPGDGRADKVPALLSNKEYVMDAETVSMLGNGDPDHGAKKLDQLRENLRKHKGGALSRGKISPDAKDPAAYMTGGRK
jgi:hypothetical protein